MSLSNSSSIPYMYVYVTGQIWFHVNFDLT